MAVPQSVESAVVLMGALTPLLTVMTPIILAVLTYWTVRSTQEAQAASRQAIAASHLANANAVQAAQATQAVARTLAQTSTLADAKVEEIKAIAVETKALGQATHALVDGKMSAVLHALALSLRHTSELSGNRLDEEAAAEAEQASADHDRKLAGTDPGAAARLAAIRANADEESRGFAPPAAPTTLPPLARPANGARDKTLAELWPHDPRDQPLPT